MRMNSMVILWASMSCCFMSCAVDYGESTTDDTVKVSELQSVAGVATIFVNYKSGLCIGVDHASMDSGALLKQFKCVSDAPNQQWDPIFRGPYVSFINFKSGKCMGVDGASHDSGANIGQFNCVYAAPDQEWMAEWNGNTYSFTNVGSDLCIGVDGASTASGAQLKQFPCVLGAANQRWTALRVYR